MEKIKQKEIKELVERETKGEEILAISGTRGITVGMTAYKPIPKFNGSCPNC